MSENKGDSHVGAIITAFLTGGLIGVGIGLLLSTYSGEETRTRIKKAGDIAKEKFSEMANEVKNKTEDILTHSKNLLDEVKGQIHSTAESFKHAMAEKKEELETIIEG